MMSADYRDYEMVTVRMSRGDLTTQWGFSVQPSGSINNVTGGGLADRAGLRKGDLIDEIQGLRCPSPETIQLMYHNAQHQIDLTVLREPASAVRLWRPEIVEEEANRYARHVNETSHERDFHVSLEHERQSHPTVPGFNKAPRKFPNEVLTESYVTSNNSREQRTGGVLPTPISPLTQFKPASPNEPSYQRSETLRLIRSQAGETQRNASKGDGTATRSSQPECFACGRHIIGLTCEVGNVYLHPDCFQCSTCGASLRNQGHHIINDKFYCDVHGTQRLHPTPDMGSRKVPQSTVKLPEPVKEPHHQEIQNMRPIAKSTNAPFPTVPRGVSEETFTHREQYAATGPRKRRVKKLHGTVWPPPLERSKTLEAIRYWKFQPDGTAAVVDPSGMDRLRNLQALISGFETGSPPCVASYSDTSSDVDVSERPYTYSKKVIPTPYRLLMPMRNPLLVDLKRKDVMPRISTDSFPSYRSPFAVGVEPKSLPSLFAADENDSIASIAGTQETCHSTSTSDYLEAPLPRRDLVSSSFNYQCNQRLPWQLIPEVVEERDIATESSMIGIEDTLLNEVALSVEDTRSRRSSETLRPPEESYDRPCSIDEEERELWIREDLEQARIERQEFLSMKPPSKPPYDVTYLSSLKAQGKPSATRDTAIREIEQHQENLQYQQEKLSELLENAIRCLHNLEEADAKLQVQQSEMAQSLHEASESDPFEGLELGSFVHLQLDNDIPVDDNSSVTRGSEVRQSLPPFQALDPPLNINHDHHAGEGVRQRGTLVNQATRVPVCEFCRKDIRGAFVLATGKAWCPEHFTCSNSACNRQLLDCGFVEEKGQKYCEKCFETLIAPICGKCGLPITADCLNALQKQWHPDCFVCTHCRKPFGNSAFYLENAQPYCEQDWNMLFTTKCTSCKYPIEAGDRWVEALGGAFHSNCFNCTVCQTNLEGQSFYAKDGNPFCRTHA